MGRRLRVSIPGIVRLWSGYFSDCDGWTTHHRKPDDPCLKATGAEGHRPVGGDDQGLCARLPDCVADRWQCDASPGGDACPAGTRALVESLSLTLHVGECARGLLCRPSGGRQQRVCERVDGREIFLAENQRCAAGDLADIALATVLP